ncbi:MAG TPA: alpha-amylase family glycosyl hydrolase [Polyangiaceae bacterium]|nr:alpha-amylase family glycosyl hydrolase [Polyangiaceae bacterium]
MSRTPSVGLATRCTFVVAALTAGCIDIPAESTRPRLKTYVDDWRNEIIYQVLVDRFANGDVNNDFHVQEGPPARYQGGDWKGLEDHLDYIRELGVTTLWISPVVRNVETDADVDAYHGYWAQDLTALNPHFGDLAALRSLTSHVHALGMKIVEDVVVNHLGQVFFYDMNMNGKPDVYVSGTGSSSPVMRSTEFDPDFDLRGVQAQTPLGIAGRAPIVFVREPEISREPPKPGILGESRAYHGLGRITNFDDEMQSRFGDFPGGLKDLATEVPEVRETLTDAYLHWVEEADFDGLRLDTIKHVEHEFWQAFSPAVRERMRKHNKTNFILFGEALDGRDDLLGSYTQSGELDSVFYFSQHFRVFHDVFATAGSAAQQKPTSAIAALWSEKSDHYGKLPQQDGIGIAPAKALVNFIDNHDRPRFLYDSNHDLPALRNALTFLFTEEGIPCVYYGTELDFYGGNDPANREVLWKTGFPTQGETFRHIAALSRLRKNYEALRLGDTIVRFASNVTSGAPDAGLFAFERTGGDAGDAYALVVVNTSGTQESSPPSPGMPVGALPGTPLLDVLEPDHAPFIVNADGTLAVVVPVQSTRILVPSDQVIAN